MLHGRSRGFKTEADDFRFHISAWPPVSTRFDSIDDIQSKLLNGLSRSKFAVIDHAHAESAKLNLQQHLDAAVARPLNYPALAESVFPGDRVAIAVQSGLPDAAKIVQAVLQQLFENGIGAEDVIIVLHPEAAEGFGFSAAEFESDLKQNPSDNGHLIVQNFAGKQLAFQVHQSTDKTYVSYLAANEAGDPIYLNRQLVDADVVLPIGFPTAGDESSNEDCLYPGFSSSEVKERFSGDEMSSKAQADEIELANDTLGSFYSIQVVHGPGGKIEKILSGARDSVRAASRQVVDEVWKYAGPQNSAVTVATIETICSKASWDDFIRAVLMAGQVSNDEAPIIVWSDLEGKPSRQIRNALMEQFEAGSPRKLSSELKKLAGIVQEHPVYLHSKLSRNEVEALGLGYVDSAAEINRIAENCEKGIVVRDAHRYRVARTAEKK